ncbi:MAG: TonB-dependent receptor [Gammaproteobacteria bacterium]|nr:TonB-dependent receptor [Gammaproteobacteria bacterium]
MVTYIKSIVALFFIIAITGIHQSVSAELELDDLLFGEMPSVFTASKYEQKISDAPARVSVITADEIRKYGYRHLTEALQSMPGIQATYDHTYTYLGIRGVNIPGDFNSRVLILIDGHRLNDNIYDGALIDQGNQVNIDMIKQIEMLRGPASSLYGSSAFLGVVNIITKDGRDLNGAQISIETGSESSNKARLSYGKQYNNGMEVLISVTNFESDGTDHYFAEFDDPATNNGVAENADDSSSDKALVKISYGDFTFSSSYAEYTKKIPTAAYETIFNDNGTFTTEGNSYFDLRYNTLLDGGADFSTAVYYDRYWYYGEYMYDYPPVTVYYDEAIGHWWGLETQFSKVVLDSHRITAGFEYRDTTKARQYAYDIWGPYIDEHTQQTIYGMFIQDEWKYNENWTFNLGVRYDDYSESESSVNPRIAAIWQEDKTILKMLYGQAFRAPNAYELYYDDGFLQKAAGTLKPETIESAEFIWEQQLNASYRLIGSIYHIHVDDMLVLVTDPLDGFELFANREEIKSEGAELELIVNLENGWSGALNYSYQSSKDINDVELVNHASNMFKLNAISPLIADSFVLGMELKYEDGRKTFAGTYTDSVILSNLTISNNLVDDGYSLSLGIYNLFDEEYSHPGFQEHIQNELAQKGRTFRLKYILQF